MMTKPGSRVGCISHTEDDKIYFFGYGYYRGNKVPPPGIGFCGVDLNKSQIANPQIRLDNGKMIYGCECWWAPEKEIQKILEPYEIIKLDIDEEREKTLVKKGKDHG